MSFLAADAADIAGFSNTTLGTISTYYVLDPRGFLSQRVVKSLDPGGSLRPLELVEADHIRNSFPSHNWSGTLLLVKSLARAGTSASMASPSNPFQL